MVGLEICFFRSRNATRTKNIDLKFNDKWVDKALQGNGRMAPGASGLAI